MNDLLDDLGSALLAMQQADSFFPTGAVAWSWGLETLKADGHLGPIERVPPRRRQRETRPDRSAEVCGFVEGQLRHRWNSFDRAFLVAAWQSADDLEYLMTLDAQVEALTMAEELRQGSRRVGQALLGVHVALGTPGAARYQQQVLAGETPGHLPVLQGLIWKQLGMQLEHCQLAAAHGLCTGLVSAAVRLGVMGHIDAQRVLTAIQPLITQLLADAAPEPDNASGFTPMAEIAVMRHETQELRLFAN
ncbi:urease accessory UreF family protein [Pseudomonas viridiflava]|uniref:Urease accessory protein UreF n=1 Tax=Pseudomonas viridiflava TaxID=33069 RepID=A0ABU7NFT0_PSEVI|nr:urease accessory UreF family protein [Pseudomonas viridiflava]MBI6576827.1 urease accessory protein UreF [Pseudomonas viridiflava]MBI6606412.1 urease accessory protein UreF [Pseudomonas viridiflava]MBI6637506.1 urease accessory protein UreF [Pseudomonas viridiflava]MBI6868738.1 urease accessory protein UreF [Pseudomonas viridiflava]MEE3937908.1 urease accessory UreF family protein [Pseudomonas viridiflava]